MNMAATYQTEEEKLDVKRRTAKPLIWMGIVGIVMFFAGLTSAYVVRQSTGEWLYFDVPSIFYASTGVILLSSLTMWLAQRSARLGKMNSAATFLIATTALGIVFTYMQYIGFLTLHDLGINFTGRESNVSGSFFVILVFAHAAHVLSGILSLIFTTVKALLKKYSTENHIGISVCGIYWHFLDILWIYLILFLVFIR